MVTERQLIETEIKHLRATADALECLLNEIDILSDKSQSALYGMIAGTPTLLISSQFLRETHEPQPH